MFNLKEELNKIDKEIKNKKLESIELKVINEIDYTKKMKKIKERTEMLDYEFISVVQYGKNKKERWYIYKTGTEIIIRSIHNSFKREIITLPKFTVTIYGTKPDDPEKIIKEKIFDVIEKEKLCNN